MDGVFDDEVEQTVTIDEYLDNVEAEELVIFRLFQLSASTNCFFFTLLIAIVDFVLFDWLLGGNQVRVLSHMLCVVEGFGTYEKSFNRD